MRRSALSARYRRNLSGEATMLKTSRSAMAALLMTAAAHAAGQASHPSLTQKPQDDVIQDQVPQKPNDAPSDTQPTDTKPAMTVFDRLEVQGILGKEVRGESNENMGRIVDVIVDRGGQVRAAIIDFGGFLGVGNRRVAVAWNALRFPPDAKEPKKVGHIGLDLNREQVQAAPEYKEDKPVVVLGASGGPESLPLP
jgi:PRC-barrel domain